MTKLHMGDHFSLPADAVTQTFAILAKRGAGKTYTAAVMAEEMLRCGQQVVAVDPTGAWFGLRSSADGKSPGFPVVVLGGEHGDVPLEESAGEVIATAIVENRFSAVLDLSLFRKGQLIRFMTTFAEALYRLNREAMHLFVDEADAVAPQGRTYGGEENRMLGAMEDIVRRGRKRGIGCTLITQRPAVLNKNVLTQAECLVALRLVHPKDIDAIEEWVNVHADPGQAEEMIGSLPALPVGTAWFWAPGWGDLFRKVEVRRRQTFDSSATPKPGETRKTPRVLAEIDLAGLGEQIKATVQKTKDNDPRELRRRLAELELQLRDRPAAVAERVEVPVLKNGQLEKAHGLVGRLEGVLAQVREIAGSLSTAIGRAASPSPHSEPATTQARPRLNPRPVPRMVPAGTTAPHGRLAGPQQRILDALAWLESVRVSQAKRTQVALLSEQSPTSSAFTNNLGSLRTAGLIDYPSPGAVCLTEAGRQASALPDVPPTSDAMHQSLYSRLPGPQGRILKALIEAYPTDLDRQDLAERSGASASSSAYTNNLGALRSLGLIDYPSGGRVVALPVLFLEG